MHASDVFSFNYIYLKSVFSGTLHSQQSLQLLAVSLLVEQ